MTEKKTLRSFIALLTAMALTMMMALALTPVAFGQNAEHCPDGWIEKVEADEDELDDVVLDEGTLFCVKAGPEATGILEADGETTLLEYVEAAGIEVGEGNVPSVSHYVIYEVPATDPPATDPPATDPPATDPPATEPPALTPPPTSMSDTGTGSGNILPVLLAGLLAAAFLFLRPAMRFSPVLRKR